MTTTERTRSRLRGEALTACITLSRSGETVTDRAAADLARALVGRRAICLADPIHTSGGAVVTFTPLSKVKVRYTVAVTASPI